ncbi:hypothetical protein MHBO_001024 [Bonamia ostreae]|uniref:Uncharacterized protein n=1 Tax=Bonamia ostreae TaxID=126728 RepID=A0ABV2AHK0_9EUKA
MTFLVLVSALANLLYANFEKTNSKKPDKRDLNISFMDGESNYQITDPDILIIDEAFEYS